MFVIAICAFGTAEPAGSVINPAMDALSSWAHTKPITPKKSANLLNTAPPFSGGVYT